MNSFVDCCNSVLNKLPNPALPFLPAFVLGIGFSVAILVYFYKKQVKKTTWAALTDILKDLFLSLPYSSHGEFMKCNSKNCVRCKKSEELKFAIVKRWKELKNRNKEKDYPNIANSVSLLNLKISLKDKDFSDIKNSYVKFCTNQEPSIYGMELVANPYWTEINVFEIERELLRVNFKTIKEEFEAIFKVFQSGNTNGWKLNTIPSGHWCIFSLIDQGVTNEENCMKCPNSTALLGSLPSLMTNCVFGNVCFSLLYPDSLIEPHFGPTNLRLRCHLGLDIPDGCWLEVNGKQYRWRSGECLVFDDSFRHSAYFGSKKDYSAPRVILLMDFWHPQVTKEEKTILQTLLKPEPLP